MASASSEGERPPQVATSAKEKVPKLSLHVDIDEDSGGYTPRMPRNLVDTQRRVQQEGLVSSRSSKHKPDSFPSDIASPFDEDEDVGNGDKDRHEHTSAMTKSAIHKLQYACGVSVVFMILQFVGGYYAGSLAIMTDAAHLSSDVTSFAISLLAVYIAAFPPSPSMPFGYHRAEVLGALVSVLVIWGLTGALLATAIQRIVTQVQQSDEELLSEDEGTVVDGEAMFIVSIIGLFFNIILMGILGHSHGHAHSHAHSHPHAHTREEAQPSPPTSGNNFVKTPMSAVALMDEDKEATVAQSTDDDDAPLKRQSSSSVFENLNVRAAYVHALGDFIQSVGVCFASVLIWWQPTWQLADPIATVLSSILVLGTTYGVFCRSVLILLEAAPPQIDLRVVEKRLRQVESVYDVHDLRIWSLSENDLAASVHILPNADAKKTLRDVQVLLYDLGIHTQTIQVEDSLARDWNEDLFCSWHAFTTSESLMSVPRATSRKAAFPPVLE